MYEYRVNIVKVIDGDTVDVDIDLGFGIWMKDERVRMMGIDTPEKFGLAAKARLKSLLGKSCVLKTQVSKNGEDMKGKFGRILGDFNVYNPATDAWQGCGSVLISEGHAVAYHGQNKEEVEQAHLENRERLLEEGIVVL
jgi:micrococcal nuclease